MKKLFYVLVLIAILYGIYYFYIRSGQVAQERIQMSQQTSKSYDQQLEKLQKIAKMKDWQTHLVSFQRLDRSQDRAQMQKLIQEIAVKHHVKVVDWNKNFDVYEFSLLADLDTDVYEFWQACARQFPGQLQPVSLGLFRPHKAHEKVQGRIHFVNVLEPREHT
jgi:hypothetical protein